MRSIRKAVPEDLPAIMEVLSAARGIMRQSGNFHQWIGGYPSPEVIEADMDSGHSFVVEDDGAIVACFAFIPSPEPTYSQIYEGTWISDTPYHVVHRMGSTPASHGIFRSILDWCTAQDPHIRIDTHRDNAIMQKCILDYGFRYCGIIYLLSGDERLAYELQKVGF